MKINDNKAMTLDDIICGCEDLIPQSHLKQLNATLCSGIAAQTKKCIECNAKNTRLANMLCKCAYCPECLEE